MEYMEYVNYFYDKLGFAMAVAAFCGPAIMLFVAWLLGPVLEKYLSQKQKDISHIFQIWIIVFCCLSIFIVGYDVAKFYHCVKTCDVKKSAEKENVKGQGA